MIRSHPLFTPIMGLTPFVGLHWEEGPEHGALFPYSKRPLSHAVARMDPTPIRIDAMTDGKTLFAVGYGIGTLFEDDVYDPCDMATLQRAAIPLHLHQLCAFIVANIDPVPYAVPMTVLDKQGMSRYIASLVLRPTSIARVDAAIERLLTHFS